MLADKRRELILDAVRREGFARVRDLAADLAVSEMTVRRDLDRLAADGLIDKVHGGAIRLDNLASFEPGFANKERLQRREKAAIAGLARAKVQPGTAIALTAGTTTFAFAQQLATVGPLTVVTNAPAIAQTLYQLGGPELVVVLTGGVRTPSDALVGPLATAALARLHIDTLFMGVHGMDAEVGYTTPNLAEAEMNQAFIEASRQVVVVADHSKWGVRGLARIAPLDRADLVISDTELAEGARRALAEADIRLELAAPTSGAERD